MKKIYAVAGSFAMKPSVKKGFTIFTYEPTGGYMKKVGEYCGEKNVGQSLSDDVRNIIYLTDESRTPDGGGIFSIQLERESGIPIYLDELRTGFSQPSFLAIDDSGKYCLIPHHASDNYVVRMVKNEKGKLESRCIYDSAVLLLVRLSKDGRFERICDGVCQEQKGKASHLHSAVFLPGKNRFMVCDKGLDLIYVYEIDYEREELVLCQKIELEEGCNPRYAKAHPHLPIIYQNNERSLYLNVFRSEQNGEIKKIQSISLLDDKDRAEKWKEEGPADLAMTKNGKYLYASIRTINSITVLEADEAGCLHFRQNIHCGGRNPRGLKLSPDERFLFSLNRDSNTITKFEVGDNGLLKDLNEKTECNLPGNMVFVSARDEEGNIK